MTPVDKWCAEQCGVEVIPEHEDGCFNVEASWSHPSSYNHIDQEWTIQDPRCREIVRERFKIYTTPDLDREKWLCGQLDTHWEYEEGKTIAEAEIACITAIWEATGG